MTAGSIDIHAVRADTPGCAEVSHFNNAGAALPPKVVHDAVVDYLAIETRRGGYETVASEAAQLDRYYSAGAELFGCRPDELAFVESATRAWSAAFTSLRFKAGDRILTGRAEYVSNALALLRAQELFGIEIVVVPDDEHGAIDVAELANQIDDRAKLIALTHVPTSNGLINPAAAVGAVAREAGVLYLLDACQSVGQIPVDVAEIGCDMCSFTGRKYLRGPRGTGGLFVRHDLLDQLSAPAGLDGGDSQWNAPFAIALSPTSARFEPFEVNFAGKAGLGAAISYLNELGIEAVGERVIMLGAELRTELGKRPAVTVEDRGADQGGIVTFSVDGFDPTAIKAHLANSNINVSVSGASSAQFDLPARGIESLVRASAHYYNTTEEIAHLVEALDQLV